MKEFMTIFSGFWLSPFLFLFCFAALVLRNHKKTLKFLQYFLCFVGAAVSFYSQYYSGSNDSKTMQLVMIGLGLVLTFSSFWVRQEKTRSALLTVVGMCAGGNYWLWLANACLDRYAREEESIWHLSPRAAQKKDTDALLVGYLCLGIFLALLQQMNFSDFVIDGFVASIILRYIVTISLLSFPICAILLSEQSKAGKAWPIVCILLYLGRTAYGHIKNLLQLCSGDYETAWVLIAAYVLALVCIPIGFFVGKAKNKGLTWFLVVGLLAWVYVPLIIVAVVAAIVLFVLRLFGKEGTPVRKGKTYEVMEDGRQVLITEDHTGRYWDESGKEWKTDNDGYSFYRA